MRGKMINPISLADYERLAQGTLSKMAYAYYAGGARDEVTLRANRKAWERIWLHYRVLVDVSKRTTHTKILGRRIESPVLIAPSAFHGLAHTRANAKRLRVQRQHVPLTL